MATSPTTSSVTAEQSRAFWDDGYLALDRAVDPDDIAEVRALLDPLFDRISSTPRELVKDLSGDSAAAAPRIAEIIHTIDLEPALLNTRAFASLQQLSSVLLGARAHHVFDHAIYKPAHNDAATSWHQDAVYLPEGPVLRPAVHIWLPLQDATLENGCMHFIGGSHREVVGHHRRNHDPRTSVLETDHVDPTQAVACPIPVGGVTLHTPGTLHYTGPNRSDGVRRAWILHFRPELDWRGRVRSVRRQARARRRGTGTG